MHPSYYKEYYTLERKHWWFLVRGKIIMDRIRRMKAGNQSNILNIGAATCRTSELLEEFGNVTSLEYDKNCCEFVREELKRPIINGSVLDLPFPDNTFDLVCAFDVLEHVQDDAKAAAEMIRVCRPGGLITVTVPAYMKMWSHHDVVNQHYRRYTRPGLLALFDKKNIKTVYKSYFNSILFIPIFLFRRTSRLVPNHWIRSGAGSDNTVFHERNVVNRISHFLFSLETPILKVVRFPFGVSFLAGLRKK